MNRLLARLLGRAQSQQSLGARGERVAALWLRKRGFKILERNLTIGRDEADLIALDPDGRTIVIIEVKTRTEGEVHPTANLTPSKQYHIARFASRLRKRKPYLEKPVRFDAIAIIWPEGGEPKVMHYPAAFESPF